MEEVYYFDDESCILKMLEQMEMLVNPFYATGLSIPPENIKRLWFSDIFRECSKRKMP